MASAALRREARVLMVALMVALRGRVCSLQLAVVCGCAWGEPHVF